MQFQISNKYGVRTQTVIRDDVIKLGLLTSPLDTDVTSTGVSDEGPKWARFAPNETNPIIFQIRFQYKCPGFVSYVANLAYIGTKSEIPDLLEISSSYRITFLISSLVNVSVIHLYNQCQVILRGLW